MDIKQQTKNVAAQGRFGDSMLLHVNPAEVKGLASQVPLTINPETGQPEAFLPFLAPIVGGMLGSSLLAGTGGILAGKTLLASAIGSGLAQTAVTGDIKKGLLAGLTGYGIGSALQAGSAAAGAQAGKELATQAVTEAGAMGTQAGIDAITQAGTQAGAEAAKGAAISTPAQNLGDIFATNPTVSSNVVNPLIEQGFRTGVPVGADTFTSAGTRTLGDKFGALASGFAQPSAYIPAGIGMGTTAVMESQEEFERQMAQLAEDDAERKRRMYEMYPEQIPMKEGGKTGYRYGRNTRDGFGNNKDINIDYGNIGGFITPPRRIPTPIGSGFMPGFMPEFNYFSGINPSATALGFNPLGTSPQNYNRPTNRFRGMQPMPPRRGFRNEGGFGFTPPPPPQFAGYGNPFMQSASYQGFYGVPQMQQTLNPYARFTQQPLPYQPYVPYVPPVQTPPDDGGGTGDNTGGGTSGGTGDGIPPIGLPPGDIGGGRKGAVKNPDPVAPPDDFVNPIINPPVGRPVEPPINVPGVTPPPSITIPIEGGADVTIPDFSRPQPSRETDPFASGTFANPFFTQVGVGLGTPINERNNRLLKEPTFRPVQNMGPDSLRDNYGVQPAIALPNVSAVPTPAAPANTPPPMSIGGPGGGRGGIFGAPIMFAEGKDTSKELPNEGLKALYASGEKGKEAVEAMGYQEGRSTNMMQDPITKNVIMFILGEIDDENAINAFVEKYGAEQFMLLRDKILKQAAGNPDAQTEGLIQGMGNSGMADDLPMNIGDKAIAAVSQDEYIIPADVVSMLGDGSSDAGSKRLDGMLDRVRMAKTGDKTQAPPLNPNKVLPA